MSGVNSGGLQYNVPIGYRQAKSGMRHVSLNLARDRVVLEEPERTILFDLGESVHQLEQAYRSSQHAAQRLEASRDTLQAREAIFLEDLISLDLLLEAHQRLADAQAAYYRPRRLRACQFGNPSGERTAFGILRHPCRFGSQFDFAG